MEKYETISGHDLEASLDRQIQQQSEWQSTSSEGQLIEFTGQPLLVGQGIFPPGDDTIQLLGHLPLVRGKSVLDYGCGTGAIAVSVAKSGAEKVVAVDINHDAVANTIRNASLWGVESVVQTLISDGIPVLETDDKFDIIAANLPGRNKTAASLIEAAQWDTNFKAHKSLFENSKNILSDGGAIFIAKSNYPELNDIIELGRKNEFSCEVLNVAVPLSNDPRRSYILKFTPVSICR